MSNSTQHMTHNQPEEGAFLVYMNGVEIPAQSVSVRMGVGEYPSARIVVAPDASLIQFGAEDRVQVAIFYKDNHYTKSIGRSPDFRLLFDGEIVSWSYITAAGERAMEFYCVAHVEVLDHVLPDFVMGPDGNAESAINAPTAGSVSASLIQTDLTFPWSIFFFGLNPTGYGEIPFEKMLGLSGEALKKAKEEAKKKLDEDQMKGFIRRPFDLIMNMLRALSGPEVEKLKSVVSGVFYARHLRKVMLPYRFLPSPLLETEVMEDRDVNNVFPILKGIQDTTLINAVQRKTSEAGVSGTIWSTFQGVFQNMYYEILSISTSPIVQVEMTPNTVNRGAVLGPPKWKTKAEKRKDAKKIIQKEIERRKNEITNYFLQLRKQLEERSPVTLEQDLLELEEHMQEELDIAEKEVLANSDRLIAAEAAEPKRPNILVNNITKPQWWFGVPPACNVVFPSMITNLRFEENYLQQPTRLYVNDKSIANNLNINDQLRSSLSSLTFGYPAQATREIWKKEGNPLISGKNFLIWPEEFFIGPNVKSIQTLPQWMQLVKEEIDNNQSVEQEIAQKALDKIDALRNNYWFEAYAQAVAEIEDKRKAQGVESLSPEEETRLRTKRVAEIEKKLLEKVEKGAEFKTILKTLKDQGIVPRNITSVVDLQEALKRRADENKSKIRYIQNVYVRYEYYRHRSAARNGAATLTFDPYIVPGFPAVFFDYLAAGQHFVGYVSGVVHSLSSQGMETTVSFVHGQTLDELVREIYDARVGNNIDGVMEDLASAPPQPIPELRDVMQTLDRAEDYFSLLFHQGAKYDHKIKSCAFNVLDAIRFVIEGKNKVWHASFDDVFSDEVKQQQRKRKEAERKIEEQFNQEFAEIVAAENAAVWEKVKQGEYDETSIDIDQLIKERIDDRELALRQKYDLERLKQELTVPRGRIPNKILDNYTGIVPSNKFRDAFAIHDVAMRYISRPICTLDEYINFRGRWGTRVKYIPWNDSIQGKGAGYYERILNLKPGPGDPPTFDENNYLVSPEAKDLPDTRLDWNKRLFNYRKKVIFGKAPHGNVSAEGTYKESQQTQSKSNTYSVVGVASDDVLNVRASPDWRADKVGELKPNATGIRRAGATKTVGRSTWWKIDSPVTGWVNSYYLEKEG